MSETERHEDFYQAMRARIASWLASKGAGFKHARILLLAPDLFHLLTRLVLNPELPDLTYGAGAFPSATLALVLALLGAVLVLAAWLPARRAAKVDPMVALRAE